MDAENVDDNGTNGYGQQPTTGDRYTTEEKVHGLIKSPSSSRGWRTRPYQACSGLKLCGSSREVLHSASSELAVREALPSDA